MIDLEKKHSLFSPSSMSRWEKCVGSISSNLKSEGNEFSEWGTLVHAVVEWEFRNWKAINFNKWKLKLKRKIKPNDTFHEIFEENVIAYLRKYNISDSYDQTVEKIYKHVNYFFSVILEISKSTSSHHLTYEIELTVQISDILPDHFGTVDALIIDRLKKIAYVVDLKTGQCAYFNGNLEKHRVQMMSYVLGVSEYLTKRNINVEAFEIKLVYSEIEKTIEFNVDTYEIEQFKDRIRAVAISILDDNSKKFTFGDHCKSCQSMANCELMKEKIKSIVEFVKKPTFSTEDFEKLLLIEPIFQSVLKKAEKVVKEETLFLRSYTPKYHTVALKNGREIVRPELVETLKRHKKVKDFISTFSISKMRPLLSDSEFEKFVTRSPATEILKPIQFENSENDPTSF